MNLNVPAASVVIPTHNRADSLRRTLDALCLQIHPAENFEVLVVADGCSDETIKMLRSYQASFALEFIEQSGMGAAAARNAGAALAKGGLLIFLDDDVVASPSLVEAHVRRHRHRSGQIVIGPYPPVLNGKTDLVHIHKRLWWGNKFQSMSRPHHRYTYRDMLSGNFSIQTCLFHHLGGFDDSIKGCGGEDYEFGARLIEEDIAFTYAPEALAHHYEHETTDLDRTFARMRQEGGADVQIGRRHPNLRSTLKLAGLANSNSLRYRTYCKMAVEQSPIGDFLASRLRRLLDSLEWLRLRGYWFRLYKKLCDYWYWRGVGDQMENLRELSVFLQGVSVYPEDSGMPVEIDLKEGVEAVKKIINEKRPDSLRIRYGQHTVGILPSQPGAEKIRGAHLNCILATRFFCPLFTALVLESALEGTKSDGPLLQSIGLRPIREDHGF